jgi:dihydropteroate synthase
LKTDACGFSRVAIDVLTVESVDGQAGETFDILLEALLDAAVSKIEAAAEFLDIGAAILREGGYRICIADRVRSTDSS